MVRRVGWRRFALVNGVWLLLLAVVVVADAQARPHCLGHRATIHKHNFRHRTIIGTHHRDIIAGTRRDDWIVGNGGRDLICGQRGQDTILPGAEQARGLRISGGPGSDRLTGTSGGDWIAGNGGRDLVDGLFGGDTVFGGGGSDFVRTSRGADRIILGPGDDHVEGSTGPDVVYGSYGNDRMATGPGAYKVYGGPGDDRMSLIWGNDKGYGGPGKDAVLAGEGADFLAGGPGPNDLCRGGLGPDRFGLGCERKPPGGRHLPLPNGGDCRIDPTITVSQFLYRLRHRARATREALRTIQCQKQKVYLRARKGIERRYRHRRRHGMSRRRASYLRSKEQNHLTVLMSRISDQIDRLRLGRR